MRLFKILASTIAMSAIMIFSAFLWHSRMTLPASENAMQNNAHHDTHSLRVITSFYTLGEFARQVGGDKALVSSIVPGGVEPHEYEPTSQDIASLYSADVVLLNGGGMDAWGESLRQDLEAHGVHVLVLAEELKKNSGEKTAITNDPHFWLDPVIAQEEVRIIRSLFSELDAQNAQLYALQSQSFISQLQALDESYLKQLSLCKHHTIISSHDVFRYLSARYGFHAVSIAGLSPDTEPSTQQLVNLVKYARDNDVKYIFFETLVSPRLADTLAREVHAETLVFNPIEGLTDNEIAAGSTYITIMQENLNQLRRALQCYE